MENYVIGIDLGGTKIAAALATISGQVLASVRRPTNVKSGPEGILATLVDMTNELLTAHILKREQLAATGIGVPCLLEKGSTICRFSPNLFWRDVDIGRFWRKHFSCPLVVDNDVRLGALAEHTWGAGQGTSNLLYVAVGTGVGSGLILDGKIYRGSRGLAGEIGHMTLVPDGPVCNCGNRGCLEVYTAGPAIARRTREAMAVAKESILWQLCQGNDDNITAELVSRAADREDGLALRIFKETGHYLGVGLASVATLLNPERIIVGGGVAQAGKKLFRPLQQTLAERTITVPGIDYLIVPAALGNQTGVLGAVAAALTILGERECRL
ncbi:MAG: ROK family protein [bacterium]|jgi:glucokinase